MDLQKIGLEGVDWIDLTRIDDKRCTVVNKEMNLRVAYNAENF